MKTLIISSSTLQFVLEMWAQWVSGLQLLIKRKPMAQQLYLKENLIITSNKNMRGITPTICKGLIGRLFLSQEDSITIPLLSLKLWARNDRGGLFSYSYPPMDLEVPTKSTPNLTMVNTIDVCVQTSANRVMKSPKRCDYASSAEPGFGSKRVYMSCNP